MIQNQKSVFQDSGFIRIVVGSTGLGLALMVGSLAAVQVNGAQHYQFGWNWTVPVWMLVAVYGNGRFWSSVWRAQNDPTQKNKRSAIIHALGLATLAIGSFLYPLRFIETAHLLPVARGLATAVIFLSILAIILVQISHALTETEKAAKETH
jgi:hypothetical protein